MTIDPTLLDREEMRDPNRKPYSALSADEVDAELRRLRQDLGMVDGIVLNVYETRARVDALLDRRLELAAR